MARQYSSGGRTARIFRDASIIILITLCILASVEIAVRLTMHERTTTDYAAEDTPLAKTDPVLGYLNNPGAIAHVTGPEFTVEYRISEQGFRDPEVHAAKGDPGKVRILLVGDSYTFGHGVQYEQSWAALVREYFERDGKPVEIINAGVPGYSTTQQVLYLERLVDQFAPDVVAIGFVAHDVATNRPIIEAGAVDKIAEGAAISVSRDKKSTFHSVLLLKRLLVSNDFVYTQVYANTDRRRWYEAPPSDWLAEQIDITKTLLSRAASISAQTDTRLVVFSMPQLFQVLVEANGTKIDGVDVNHIDSVLSAHAKMENITWISALPELAAEYARSGEALYFRMDGHFNAHGNKVFADISYKALKAAAE